MEAIPVHYSLSYLILKKSILQYITRYRNDIYRFFELYAVDLYANQLVSEVLVEDNYITILYTTSLRKINC